MKAQNLILAAVAIYAGVGEATLCWTNGLNLLMGGKPWGAGCSQLPVNPPPPPPPPPCPACPACPACPVIPPTTVTATVTTTVVSTSIVTSTTTTTTTSTSTTTSYGINPATANAATAVCMGLNPPRATPLFDASGGPACCVPIVVGGQRVC